MKKVSVVIPTKNEPLINELVEEIHKNIREYDHEIVVVDKSNTEPNISGAKLVRQKSNGLGPAIMEGLAFSEGDVIVTMDGDFSHDPKEICKLLDKVNDYDIVIGSKFIEGGINEDNPRRNFISKAFQFISQFVLRHDLKDPMSGFSAVRREIYDVINPRPIGYKINLGLIYKAKRHGFKVCEVPITFHKRRAGKTKTGIAEAYRTIRYILELRFGLR